MNIPANMLAPVYEQNREEYNDAAIRVLSSGWYILGEEVSSFEKEFASYIGSDFCVGVNSGLDALILAIRALEIGPGDEVIVQANTYIATVLAITENGATPVFVEPDKYHGIDPNKIEKAITPNTKAIMVVHLYGHSCDMDPIIEISNRCDIPVIEDCAQSHGAIYNDMKTGALGKIGCFSFFPTKNLGAFGDGGAIVTNDRILAENLTMLRNYGSRKKYYNDLPGVNSRLDEIQAALLKVKLKHLEEILDERADIAYKYLKGIHNPLIKLPEVRDKVKPVWHLFTVQSSRRDQFQEYLKTNGIQSQIHYPIPPHLSDAYKGLGYTKGSFPITESIADTIVSLPLYNGMTDEEIEYVIDIINSFKEV